MSSLTYANESSVLKDSGNINVQALFQDALSGITDGFDIYELTAGNLIGADNITYLVHKPVLYITNFSNNSISNYYSEIVQNITMVADTLDIRNIDKEPFVSGVVSLCFVLSGIVTGSWMLFLLVLLSSNTIPNSLLLANLFHSIGNTVMLLLLTNYLHVQVEMNFQDTQELRDLFTSSTSFIIVKTITSLLIYISWMDLLVQITKYEQRRKTLIFGLCLSLVTFAFAVAYNFLYGSAPSPYDPQYTTKFIVIKGFHYSFNLILLIYFTGNILLFSIKKKRFAYHKKRIPLAIFSLVILSSTFAFTLMDIISDVLRTWGTNVAIFSNLCVTVTVWEWLHSIRQLEDKYERITVLGRKISNDSFSPADPKRERDQNNYILKSLNVVDFINLINLKISRKFNSIFNANKFESNSQRINERKSNEEILLYEIEPMNTRASSSVQSQEDNISYVGEYPQFNVDHRYLRNTPSTTGPDSRRPTPMTPDH